MKNKYFRLNHKGVIVFLIGVLTLFQAEVNARSVTKADIKKSTIFHVTDPIRPGEALLLTGDWPVNAKDVSSGVEIEAARLSEDGQALVNKSNGNLKWQRIRPQEVSGQSLKFTIPENWAMGVYACRVVPSKGTASFEPSQTVLLNAPDPWWLQGDGGTLNASPGGWIRIFGKSLHFTETSQVQLELNGKITVLTAKDAGDEGGYALLVELPENLTTGIYTVLVHNGFGGKDSWRKAGQIQISPEKKWKQDVFNVYDFKENKNVEPTDWTSAIKAALVKAEANGGGVVFFPRGRYVVNEPLIIPRYVILRGENQALVNLYWPPREKALPALITGSDDFAVEDISIYTDGAHRDIIAGQNNMRVQRVRIRADAYYRHDYVGDSHAVKPVSATTRNMGAGVRMSGNNVVLTDCEIYHSGCAVEMYHTDGGLVARNRFDYGKGPMHVYGLSRVIIEDNECSAASLWASGFGISLHSGACASYNIYFAHNKLRQNYGGDREAVTTDGHGTAYFGKIANADGTSLTLKDDSWLAEGYKHKDVILFSEFQKVNERKMPKADQPLPNEWHGMTFYILDGRGAGQYRNVVGCNGKQIKIDRPWLVNPDSTSVVSIGKFQGRMLFVGNEFRDAGTSIQLYPPNTDCIVAENQSWRVESMNCGAEINRRIYSPTQQPDQKLEAIRVEPSWYNQFLDNHIWEGNCWGNRSAVLVVSSRGQFIDPQKIWVQSLPISRAHVLRNNTLENNAGILVDGAVKDVIIENNTVRNVGQGIVVMKKQAKNGEENKSNFPEGIFIGKNSFTGVNKPVTKP